MGRRRKTKGKGTFSGAVFVLLIGLTLWVRWRDGAVDWLPGEVVEPERGRFETVGGFQWFGDCRLVDERGNDGDSFRVSVGGDEIVVRLYFVDAAESYVNPRGYNRERLADQGEYFGGLGQGETVLLGQEAKKVVLGALGGGGFEVYTKWQRVFDSERMYGFVRFTGGEWEGQYLSEVLVARGLARIHTTGADLPDGTSEGAFERRLGELEEGAKAGRVGAWGR